MCCIHSRVCCICSRDDTNLCNMSSFFFCLPMFVSFCMPSVCPYLSIYVSLCLSLAVCSLVTVCLSLSVRRSLPVCSPCSSVSACLSVSVCPSVYLLIFHSACLFIFSAFYAVFCLRMHMYLSACFICVPVYMKTGHEFPFRYTLQNPFDLTQRQYQPHSFEVAL